MTEKEIRSKVVEIAKGWLGCKESDGSHKKIIDTYNACKPLPRSYAVKYTDAWCATFASAVGIKAELTDIIPRECSCNQFIQLAKNMGIWVENDTYTPSAGDMILYDWDDNGVGDNTGSADHIGIVVSVSGGVIKVIEGNKSNAVGYRELAVNGKELNDAGYRNTVGKPWKPMDIPKFVYDCKNVGTMIINKERHDFESKQTIKLPKEEWVYVENALPPIVTQEEWDLICKIHEERVIATGSDRRGKKTSGYSFSGKLVCGICGAPYWRKQRVSKDEYWVCSTKQTKGRKTRKRDSTMGKAGEINPLGCDNENISYNSLMEIMGVVSERLQANTDTIKQDMINWLTKLRKQLLEANGGHTEADLQRELSRKSKLLDAYLDGILNKQEYQKKAEELDERIIQLKTETEKNKANSGDIAEIDKVLANIDEEVARYVDGNEKLKVEYLLEHLEQVQIFPDKVIVIVPILSEGIVVEKTQYVSREKRCRQDYLYENDRWSGKADKRRDIHVWIRWKGFVKGTLKSRLPD